MQTNLRNTGSKDVLSARYPSSPPLNRTEVDGNGYVTEYQSPRLDKNDSDYYNSKEYQYIEGQNYKNEMKAEEEECKRQWREAEEAQRRYYE